MRRCVAARGRTPAFAGRSPPAQPIAGLFNTGVDNSGTVLPEDAVDPHYTFTVLSGTASGTMGYATANGSFPLAGNWLPNDGVSAWITPSTSQGQSYDPSTAGSYKWSLGFDLTGFVPSTASLSFRWMADNLGTVSFNNVSLPAPTLNSPSILGFTNWSPTYNITTGFVAGINTLDFFVTNAALGTGNPTGLRVEFLSSQVTPVPEPATLALMAAGLGVIGAAARRRKAHGQAT